MVVCILPIWATKNSHWGFPLFNDGISFSKLSTIEVVWEVFLLYHMNRMHTVRVRTPTIIKRDNNNIGGKEKG